MSSEQEKTENPTSKSAGSSPRIYPRPKYAPVSEMILRTGKEILWQSASMGVVLTFALFPWYQKFISFLRLQLGQTYGSDKVVLAVFLSLVHIVSYVTINSFFGICDTYGFLNNYKLSRKPYMKAKPALITKTLLEAAFGQLILGPIAIYYLYPRLKSYGMLDIDDALPSPAAVFRTFVIAHLFNGVGFYCAHRLFHSKALYATFHKQHHEFAGTIGIAAEYANPVEQIFANLLPTFGGVMFFGTHPLVMGVWLFLRLQQTYEAHSGYCFVDTWYDALGLSHADQACHHDFHHTVNTGNFGVEYLDWLFGTQDHWVAAGSMKGYIEKRKKELNEQSTKK